MNREERAKQFMPFDALKGLKEELKKREERRLRQDREELRDEEIESLTKALNSLKNGMRVSITYYNVITERYVTITDTFIKLYRETRIFITENFKINFDDLKEVIVIDF